MSDLNDLTGKGWFVTFVTATWAIFLRALIGRYADYQKDSVEVKNRLSKTLHDIEIRLTRIEIMLKINHLE
jgi:hypothetical protein